MKKIIIICTFFSIIFFNFFCNYNKGIKIESDKAQISKSSENKKFSRFHLTIESGYFHTHGVASLKNSYTGWGYSDNTSKFYLGLTDSGYKTECYPRGESGKYSLANNIRIEYSLTKKWALGFLFTPLGQYSTQGYDFFKTLRYEPDPFWGDTEPSGILLTGDFNGNSLFMTASFNIIPDEFIFKNTWKIGAGLGLSDIHLKFTAGEVKEFSKRTLSLVAFIGYDLYINRNISLGFGVDYKYIPFKINAFKMISNYKDYEDVDAQTNIIDKTMEIKLSEQMANFGGFSYGLHLGIHF